MSSGSAFSTILLARALRCCEGPTARRVLDVGCGESPYRALLSPELYIGVDRDPNPPPSVSVAVGDATALPVMGDYFDGIVCTEVIEHVSDERRLAAELARVAQVGAVLVLSSPFVHGLHEQPYDFRRLTSIGLCRVLEEAGWDVVRMVSVGGSLVVSVDSLLRAVDSLARRLTARVLGRGAALRAMTIVSRSIQEGLAALALASWFTKLGPIDPNAPTPRLTLGYVVVARRRGPAEQ